MFRQGCEIGIHGLKHTDMKKLSQKKNEQNLAEMKKRLVELLGETYVPRLMRPPYGNKNSAVLKAVKNAEVACILWSIDTRDWSNRNKTKIVKIVKKEVKNGSIILFHDRISATLEAIDELIPWLQEQGYDLVTVTELLESTAPIEYGKSYRQKPAK
jgi:peptidoglycan/xylan/chitin deacetylase (PgdA/CDA1 family)